MRPTHLLLTAALGGLAALGSAQEPATKPAIKVDIKELKLEQQLTPQFQALGVTEKRWKPKTWLEMDVGLKIKLPRSEGGSDASAASLEVRYFIGTTGKDKEGKTIVLTGGITYQNVPADGESHALAYISPSALQRALMKENGNKNDAPAFGVDVYFNGQPVATQSSSGGRWWSKAGATENDADKFSFQDAVIPKAKTPFNILWGDYDLQVETK
jgi:hypothetical protein